MADRQARKQTDKQNIRLLLSYDGGSFGGWQKVQNGKKPTVQGTLEELLGGCFRENLTVTGSGRTDAGVHAYGQVANVHVPAEIWRRQTPEEWRDVWNEKLPSFLRVRSVEEAPADFHSRYSAVGKTYAYLVDEREVPSVFTRKYAYACGKKLDLAAMEQAAEYLLGEHDFSAFASKMESGRGTVRRLDSISFKREPAEAGRWGGWQNGVGRDGLLHMEFSGNGFLYHMVRIMAGTLLEAGLGERTPASVKKALMSGDRQDAGVMLPGQGLILLEVRY